MLALLAAAFLPLVILNLMKLDITQRITLGIAIVALSYFVGHTIHITRLRAVQSSGGASLLGERVSPTARAHLHITGFGFTAPVNPGGHAETKVTFINNGSLTADVISVGRMAFYVADSDKRTRKEFEDSLFVDSPAAIPRGHPQSFILSYGTDRSISISSSPWDKSAIDAFLNGHADIYVAGKLIYSDEHKSYETRYCAYMKASGEQFFSNKYNDEP